MALIGKQFKTNFKEEANFKFEIVTLENFLK
jgi:hypothetical protein